MSADRKPRQEKTFESDEIDQMVTSPEFMINGNWRGKDLISLKQCTKRDIEIIMELSSHFESLVKAGRRSEYCHLFDGKLLAEIFTQQSLRTYSKFFAAAVRLGAH